ncbi:MAG: GAF and ANTAR domain-containing protein [Nitriliruptoraceae bacterium]
MPIDRRSALEIAAANGHLDGDFVQRLAVGCAWISGGWQAAIEVRKPNCAASLRGTSSLAADAAADLGFTIGQGPTWDALAAQRPILVVDVGIDPRWPQAGPAKAQAGVRSVAALPLQVGETTLGTLTLFHDQQATLDRRGAGDLLELAAALTRVLVEHLAGSDNHSARIVAALTPAAVVHQATGMVAIQLDCDLADALARLRGHAYSRELPLANVAAAIVTGALQLAA